MIVPFGNAESSAYLSDAKTLNSLADRIFPFKKFLRALSDLRILRKLRNARAQIF
ncbi:hypothetical protein AGMMS49959_02820 [Planctomycetales bacterium]|nr:hypothetical protein AGMMS49959_02820 [Planctomycetales bacterium]